MRQDIAMRIIEIVIRHHSACQRVACWNGWMSNRHHRTDQMEYGNASTTQSRRFPAVRCLLTGQFVSLLLAVTAFPGPRNNPVIDRLSAQWEGSVSPGAALVIVKDGAVVYEHGYGYASLEHRVRITPQTVFEAG